MRLVATSQERDNTFRLAEYLLSLDIHCHVETSPVSDWGSEDYGTATYSLWVTDEEQSIEAQRISKDFYENPNDPKYTETKTTETIPSLIPNLNPETSNEGSKARNKRPTPWSKEPIGFITLYFLIGCCLLFFITESTAPVITEKLSPQLPSHPIYYSDTKKELLFDYPQAYVIIDKLVKAYGLEKLQNLEDLPKEGLTLLNQYNNTPFWHGYYYEAVNYLRNPTNFQPSQAPKFEKIREGEVWRLFTPALLHGDIFHILFNMMWLAVMGRQLEQRLGRWRYLLFICVAGIITNIAQYYAGGANFLGFSAILCGMLTFIWTRQKIAPWEGYQLQASTFGFILFFLFTLLTIQFASFYTEITFGQSIAPPFANTGHMSGLLIGLILGRLNFFAWK